jgi:hypothetical protein
MGKKHNGSGDGLRSAGGVQKKTGKKQTAGVSGNTSERAKVMCMQPQCHLDIFGVL